MFKKTTLSKIQGVLITTLLLVVSACGSDNVLSPQFEPEIINQQDSFEFQATDLTGVSQVLAYTWQNSGISANVNQSSSITGGSASIVVKDSQGAVVYSGNLNDDGTFETSEGGTGPWTITVTLSDTEGTLNFRLEKRT